jgi:polyphosphate glucokinase
LTLPAVITGGIARTAANIDPSWIGTDVGSALGREVPGPVEVLNDADAAGLAEVRYGAARDAVGVVLVLTFGTGIGSALFVDGRLVPNTELGHIEVGGADGEHVAAAAVREREGLSWSQWAERVQRYLQSLERFLWPDLIVVGGGVSKRADKWLPMIQHRTPIVAAQLQNAAGIVGAALAAAENRGY